MLCGEHVGNRIRWVAEYRANATTIFQSDYDKTFRCEILLFVYRISWSEKKERKNLIGAEIQIQILHIYPLRDSTVSTAPRGGGKKKYQTKTKPTYSSQNTLLRLHKLLQTLVLWKVTVILHDAFTVHRNLLPVPHTFLLS